MTFTKEQTTEAFQKLSPQTQSLIMDGEVTNMIWEFLKNSGLNNDQTNEADSEILYAMYGLQTLQETISNIAKISGKNISDLNKLRENLESNIFNKILPSKTLEKFDWQSRVEEISKKYNLNDSQKNTLVSITKEALTDLSKKDNALEGMSQKLGVSEIISEQILADLEKRVFEYSLKAPIIKDVKTENKPTYQAPKIDKMIYPNTSSIVPEIKPNNLPMVEEGENVKIGVPKYAPVGQSSYKPTGTQNNTNSGTINYQKTENSINLGPQNQTYTPTKPQEPVQRPANVPRFNAVEDEIPQKTVSPSTIMDSKLNSVTSGVKENTTEKQTPIVKQYSVDPYREPLE